jgi:hypothetical protein
VLLTEDLVRAELQRRVAGGEVRAAGRRGARGGGRCRGSPGSWAPRVDSWCSYGGATRVKRVGKPPAVRDRGGRANYRRRSSSAIPMIASAEVECGGLGKLPGVEEKL